MLVMTQTAHSSEALGDYADVIRALHDKDQHNRAIRTRRAIVLGTLLVALGGAAFQDGAPSSADGVFMDEAAIALR